MMSNRVQNSAPADRFPWTGLIVLAGAVFLSVTSEMIPTGLLPDMSSGLHVSESQVGLLVTVFAFTVVLTSTPLAAATRRMPRHGLLIAVLLMLGASNLWTALAPSYAMVVVSRVVGGLAHGLFWAVVGAYAAHLVPKAQIGRAVSITLGGGTLAFVIGVPVGTAAGHAFGWRLTFAFVGLLMLVGAGLVWRFLPRVRHLVEHQGTGKPTTDPTIGAVALACLITALIMVGHYAFYTYFAPYLINLVGVDPADIGLLLFCYGVAGAIGLLLSAWLFGPRPNLGLVVALILTGVAVAVLGVFTGTPLLAIAAFLTWGFAFGALPALMQTRLLHAASERIRDTASAVYTTAFNIGIGGGALVGAIVFDTLGVGVEPFFYVGMIVLVLVLVLITNRQSSRRVDARAVRP